MENSVNTGGRVRGKSLRLHECPGGVGHRRKKNTVADRRR